MEQSIPLGRGIRGISLIVSRGVRGIFQREQSHFSRIFPGRNLHFGSPKTKFMVSKAKSHHPILQYLIFHFHFTIFAISCLFYSNFVFIFVTSLFPVGQLKNLNMKSIWEPVHSVPLYKKNLFFLTSWTKKPFYFSFRGVKYHN